MQGITVALSPKGIQYFVQMLTASGGSVNAVLSGIKPADRSIPISDFDYIHNQGYDKASYTSITVKLTNGNVSGFNSVLQSFQQQVAGAFQIVLLTGAFNANYSWEEDFTEQDFNCTRGGTWAHCSPNNNPTPYKNTYAYVAGISSLGITAIFGFAYNAANNIYTLPLTSITATPGNANANIPGSSIIQDQVNGDCVQSHVDGATLDSIDDIDFKSALQSAFGGYLASIPASGQLFQDPTKGTITFAFSVGDSQLAFPNNQGLTVGVTGISTYTPVGQPTQQFPGTPPTGLPVPPTSPLFLFGGIPASEAQNFDAKNIAAIKTDFATYSVPANAPTQPPQYPLTNPTVTVIAAGSEWLVLDSNNMQYQVKLINNGTINQLQVFYICHLQMYVSDYVLNGLYWAFFMAGQLSTTVTPATFPDDPDVLKVKTYMNNISSLKPYSTRAMNAIVSAKTAPTLSFQTIYIFTSGNPNSAMAKLQAILPTDIYNDISGLANNAYTNTTDVEADLTASGVPNNYFSKIENAIAMMGVVVTHDILFKMVIEDAPLINGELPYFQFDVNRIDVLPEAGLVLGVSNQAGSQAQTLQFTFVEVSASATFESSNIPKFDGQGFADNWGIIGDKPYDDLQTEVGKTGAPLPIMKGFSFLFENALLNIEQNATCGFVAICANVEFKG